MNYVKRIICLANSRKMSGRCIAGLEFEESQVGDWIRPVSSRPDGELTIFDWPMEDGTEPGLLDILRIPMIEPRPNGCQTENHLIDHSSSWVKVGEFPKQQLLRYCSAPNPLWINGCDSMRGLNDRIPEGASGSLPESLVLVEPQQLRIEIRLEDTKPKVRAEFRLADQMYNLSVTDPVVERQCHSRAPGFHIYRKRAVACISIGEPFHGYCYKLVASIIPL